MKVFLLINKPRVAANPSHLLGFPLVSMVELVDLLNEHLKGLLFLLGAWLGLINIDFEHHVVMTERARIDTEGKKERLAEHLFGPKESQ